MTCYKLKSFFNNKGLLDKSVDATYIIHLVNNGRIDHIYKQIDKYKPTKHIYILFNKGYKNCNKNVNITTPSLDLIDSFLYIFKDAKSKNYNNILILEDDFTFVPEINDINVINDVNSFINNNLNNEFIYHLGCIPCIQIPSIINNSNKVLFSCGMHAAIYSKKIINKILKTSKDIFGWDIYINMNYIGKRYMHNKLLCYQLFPLTDNSKHWGNHNFIAKFLGIWLFKLFQLLKLNEREDIGYPFFYMMSKMIFILIISIILVIVKKVYKNIFRL